MKNNQAFNQQSISADLQLIEIHQFDIDDFAAKFKGWVDASFFRASEPKQSEKDEIKTPVIFSIDRELAIDSADLALILEVARQQNLIPLGFINDGKVVEDYASFTNLALFDHNHFDSNLSQSTGENQAIKLEMQKKIESLNQQLEALKAVNLKLKNKEKNHPHHFDFDAIRENSEKFYQKVPRFIEGDISENLKLDQITFISGNVFLPVEITAIDNLYIFGTCFGQLSISSEIGQVYIKKLRARRIRIGSYHIESSEFDADLIDQSVLFYLANNQIEYRVISD